MVLVLVLPANFWGIEFFRLMSAGVYGVTSCFGVYYLTLTAYGYNCLYYRQKQISLAIPAYMFGV
jgi:hypothetical protein